MEMCAVLFSNYFHNREYEIVLYFMLLDSYEYSPC